MSVHGFVDESVRGDRYLLAVTTVETGRLRELRSFLRALVLAGQRELHMKDERPARRRQILDQIVAAGVEVTIYGATGHGREQERARAACLRRAVADLIARDAQRLILDSRPGRDVLDSQVIRSTLASAGGSHDRLSWEHLDSAHDALIWVSDIIAWAYGAGGDYRRRAAPAVAAVIDCD